MIRNNLTGKVFEWLTVDHYVGQKTVGKNNKTTRSLWDCICICGNHVVTTSLSLQTGAIKSCGCKKKLESKKRIKNEVGKIYNNLLVKELLDEHNKDGRVLFLCECLLCGKECKVTGKALRSGTTKSCGCLKEENRKNIGNRTFKDLTGKIVGYLLVESRAPNKYSKAGNQTTMWNCKCLLCGNHTVVAGTALWGDHTRSCGCLHMSYAEKEINDELQRLGIDFIFDYSFDDLISPFSENPLRFDFALFEDDWLRGLIEYQGPQHYQSYQNGFGDMQREITDPMKREYCKKYGIPLFEIKFDSDIITELHNALSIMYHTSYDNTVPSVQNNDENHDIV